MHPGACTWAASRVKPVSQDPSGADRSGREAPGAAAPYPVRQPLMGDGCPFRPQAKDRLNPCIRGRLSYVEDVMFAHAKYIRLLAHAGRLQASR
jgi:hypothetical protein